MKLRKLARLCEHDRMGRHVTRRTANTRTPTEFCPGGVFLPDDTLDLLEAAWGIIANAYGGDWMAANAEWQEAAIRWRDRYHAVLDALSVREAEADPNQLEVPFKNDRGAW